MGVFNTTCAECNEQFKVRRRKVKSVKAYTVSPRLNHKSKFFVAVDCTKCGKSLVKVLDQKAMRKLGYNDGELNSALAGIVLAGG